MAEGHGLKLVGDWKKAKQVLADAPGDMDRAIEAACAALAEFLAGQIKKYIGSNVGPPNSPFTVITKGSSKTLNDKGDPRNAARAVKVSEKNYFVGIPASVMGKNGSMARLASVLEEGRTIVMAMTDKQRRFLHATLGKKVGKVGKGASTGILVIHIPPRPFVRPVFDAEQPTAGAKFETYLKRNLKRIGK